jgi:four helix bundle protein
MRRAAVSVPSNIVEGCARDSQADYLRFLTVAFGSLRELHYQTGLSKRLGFLRSKDALLIEPKIVETEKVLNGLIRALRKEQDASAFRSTHLSSPVSLQPKHLSKVTVK